MIIKRIAFFLLGAGLVLFVPTALAQSGNFQMIIGGINNGGWTSSDSRFTLLGTAGQFNANNAASDGHFMVAGGLWPESVRRDNTTVYLPLVVRTKPTTPPPPTEWRPLSQPNLNVAVLALHNTQLLVGERIDTGNPEPGGLYQGSVTNCASASTLTRIPSIQSSILGLDFKGGKGVLAAYDKGIFYSNDGVHWTLSPSSVLRPRSVIISSGAVYAGTQDQGLYLSENDGVAWTQRNGNPQDINIVKIQGSTLWIGTGSNGAWKLIAGGTEPRQLLKGLNNDLSKKTWDFAFAADNTIYLATDDGVYSSNGNVDSSWQPFDVQLKELRSLEIVGNQLYAGVRNNGVWRHSLAGGAWERVTSASWNNGYTVRDLLYDASNCRGLLAATNDGVWLYPLTNVQ